MGHSSHNDTRPLGLSDIIAGGLIFLLLAWACISLAGPDGVGFLKGLLNSERSYELLVSGALFLLVWLVVGELAAKPYLANHMLREEKTKGLKEKSIELKKEIESLKLEVVSELRTARLDGVKKRDEVLSSARKIANQVIEAEKVKIDKEWEKISADLSKAETEVFSDLDKEVSSLSSTLFEKIIPSGAIKVLHSLSLFFIISSFFSLETAYAASGHANVGIETLLYPTLNFTIYCILLVWVFRKFVKPVLRNYRAEVESYAVQAQNEFITLERERDQLRFRLEHIGEEKAELLRELEVSAQNMAKDIELSSQVKIQGMRKDLLQRADSEQQKIRQAAKSKLVEKVMSSVKNLLNENYSTDLDKEFVKSALDFSNTRGTGIRGTGV